MNKIIVKGLLLMALLFTFSCDEDDDTSFLNNRTSFAYFAPGSSAELLVRETGVSTYNVVVRVSEAKSVARSFSVSIDPSSTAVAGTDYNADLGNLTIEPGSIAGVIPVTGIFESASVDGKALVLNLESAEGSDLGVVTQFTLNIIKFCPLAADFTGDYDLSVVALGIFDTPTMTPGTVTVTVGSGETDRVFSVAPYPAFGTFTPFEFNFSLICGKIVVPAGQVTGVGCGGVTTTLGPQATVGEYDPADDSSFTIYYADDEAGGSCGDEIAAAIMLTKL